MADGYHVTRTTIIDGPLGKLVSGLRYHLENDGDVECVVVHVRARKTGVDAGGKNVIHPCISNFCIFL